VDANGGKAVGHYRWADDHAPEFILEKFDFQGKGPIDIEFQDGGSRWVAKVRFPSGGVAVFDRPDIMN
jgi:hypothetical protein